MTIFRTTKSTHDEGLRVAPAPHTSKQKTRSIALRQYGPVSIICVFALIFFTACGMFEDFEKYSKAGTKKDLAVVYVFDKPNGLVFRSEDSGASFGSGPVYGDPQSGGPVAHFLCDKSGRHIVQYSSLTDTFDYYETGKSQPESITSSGLTSFSYFATDNTGYFYYIASIASNETLFQFNSASTTVTDISTLLSIPVAGSSALVCTGNYLFAFQNSNGYRISVPGLDSNSPVSFGTLKIVTSYSFMISTTGGGDLSISGDNGINFTSITPLSMIHYDAITSDDTGRIYCVALNTENERYIIYTEDGNLWSIGAKLPSTSAVYDSAFATDFNGSIYLVQDNKLYRSDDSGSSLQMVYDAATAGITLTSVDIFTARNQ